MVNFMKVCMILKILAMAHANKDAKKFNVEPEKIKLPKLKKVNLVKT